MRKYKPILYTLAIAFIALALRLYRISEQSVWFDEWLTYVALPSDTLLDMLRNLFFYVAEMAVTPVYFVFAYCVTTLFGLDVLLLRMLSLLPGVFSIVLLFMLGRRIGGLRVGAVAALCLALSPQHIWHNQEIRPYSLLFLFCLVALLALLYWRESGSRRWFLLNYLFNGLLLFTHLFGVLFLIPQGLYLLQRKEYKVYAKWTCSHLLFVFVLLAAILVKPHLSEGYHPSPDLSLGLTLFNFFPALMSRSLAADVLSRHNGLWPAFETSTAGAGHFFCPPVLLVRPWLDIGLLLVILGCVGVFTLRTGWAWTKDSMCGIRGRSMDKWSQLPERVLLVSLALVPSALLALLSLIFWTNFSDYGHDIYNTIAIYCIIGVVLSWLPRSLFRIGTVLLVCLFGYQCLIFLPDSTRTEWRLGAQHIQANASEQDLVLDLWWHGPASRKIPYFSDSPLVVRRVSTLTDICDEAVRFYQSRQDFGQDDEHPPSVWLLAEARAWQESFSHMDFIAHLKQGLAARNLTGSATSFPGGFNLVVVHIHPLPNRRPCLPRGLSRELWTVDYEAVLDDLGVLDASPGRREEMMDILQRTVGVWPAVNAMGRATYPLDLIQKGDLDLAEAMARHLVLENPSFGLGYLGLAMVWAAQGEDQRAFAAFKSAFSHHLSLKRFFGDFAFALCQSQDLEAAQDALEPIQALAVPLFHQAAAYILELRGTSARSQTAAKAGWTSSIAVIEKEVRLPVTEDWIPTDSEPLLTDRFLDDTMRHHGENLWIDDIFEAQDSLTGLTWWLPLYKYLPAAWIELRYRLTGNAEKTVEQYQGLIKRFPFEKRFYARCDTLLLYLDDPERYEASWRDWAAYNPEMAPIACRALTARNNAAL